MIISSHGELKALREGGKILAEIMEKLSQAVEPGKNAGEIDELAKKLCVQYCVKPAFEGYQGFPGALCVSINEEVAHGVPGKNKIFKEGDIVSLDFGVAHKGFYTDYAITFGLGLLSQEEARLIEVTAKALEKGILTAKTNRYTGDIGYAIEQFIKRQGDFGIVRRLVGHGIGRDIHEEPKIPNFGEKRQDYQLHEGEVIAIEPMVILGSEEILLAKDNFTYKTKDGSKAAHFEKTVVVFKNGAEILT